MRVTYNIILIISILIAGCIQQSQNHVTADNHKDFTLVEFLKAAKNLNTPITCYSDNNHYRIHIYQDRTIVFNDNQIVYQNTSSRKSYLFDKNRDCWVEIYTSEFYTYDYLPMIIRFCEVDDNHDKINITELCFDN